MAIVRNITQTVFLSKKTSGHALWHQYNNSIMMSHVNTYHRTLTDILKAHKLLGNTRPTYKDNRAKTIINTQHTPPPQEKSNIPSIKGYLKN